MKAGNFYTRWYYFRKGKVGGSIAAAATMVIAAIFLFAAVTYNLGDVARVNLVTANATDGAVTTFSSYIGSYGNMLSWKYLDGKKRKCETYWAGFFALLGAAILIPVGLYVGGTLGTIMVVSGAISGVSAGVNEAVVMPAMAEGIQNNLSGMPLEVQLSEQAIFYALRNAVDDPVRVGDKFDADRDFIWANFGLGINPDFLKGETVSRFAEWYFLRTHYMGVLSGQMLSKLEVFLPKLSAFTEYVHEFHLNFTADSTQPLIGGGEGYAAGGYPTAERDGEFIALLEDLADEGLRVSFWKEDANAENRYDEVDALSDDSDLLYRWAKGRGSGGLLGQSSKNLLRSSSIWRPQLYQAEEDQLYPATGGEELALPLIEQLDPEFYQKWKQAAAKYESDNQHNNHHLGSGPGSFVGKFQAHSKQTEQWILELYGINYELEKRIARTVRPLRRQHLRNLQQRVASAITTLNRFQEEVRNFSFEAGQFEKQMRWSLAQMLPNVYTNVVGLLLRKTNFGAPNFALYPWTDNRGDHAVFVATTPYKVPHLEVSKSGAFVTKICIELKDYQGVVGVLVIRYDGATPRSSAQPGRPAWKFRYMKDAQLEEWTDETKSILLKLAASPNKKAALAYYSYDMLPIPIPLP